MGKKRDGCQKMNVRQRIAYAFFMALLIIFTAVGYACSIDHEHTLTFDSRGGREVEALKVVEGTLFALPATMREGHVFSGWYSEPEGGELFKSHTTFEQDTTLYARWETVAYQDHLDSEKNPLVTIEIRDLGVIELELFPKVAPNTVRNFIALIEKGVYDGVGFHRVIEDFMVQGGQIATSTCTIEGEFTSNGFTNDLKHTRGVISMARTMNPNSASSQFFIVHKTSPHLDGQYAAFGGVISGLHILDAIASVKTDHNDVPLQAVVIDTMRVDTKGVDYDPPVCVGGGN